MHESRFPSQRPSLSAGLDRPARLGSGQRRGWASTAGGGLAPALLILGLVFGLGFAAPPIGAADQPGTERPPEASGLLAQAASDFEAGRLDQARERFARARQLDPTDYRAALGLGLVAEAAGELGPALAHLATAAELAPEGRPLGAVELARGRTLARYGAVQPALAALARARERDPERLEGYLLAAILLRDLDRRAEALSVLERGLEQATPHPRLFSDLGMLLLAEGRVEDALASAHKGLERFPEDVGLHLLLGLAQAKVPERGQEAIDTLESVLAAGRDGVTQRLELAGLLLAQDRPEEALTHLDHAGQLAPQDPEVPFRRAEALSRLGRTEQAAAARRRFAELRERMDQVDAQAGRRGRLLSQAIEEAQSGRLTEALQTVDTLLAEVPTHGRALAFRAKLLASLGRTEEAYSAAARALEADPGRLEHHYLATRFLLELGRLPDAEEALDELLRLSPSSGEAHELAAVLAFRQERYAVALAHFDRALAAGIDSEELRRARDLARERAQAKTEAAAETGTEAVQR